MSHLKKWNNYISTSCFDDYNFFVCLCWYKLSFQKQSLLFNIKHSQQQNDVEALTEKSTFWLHIILKFVLLLYLFIFSLFLENSSAKTPKTIQWTCNNEISYPRAAETLSAISSFTAETYTKWSENYKKFKEYSKSNTGWKFLFLVYSCMIFQSIKCFIKMDLNNESDFTHNKIPYFICQQTRECFRANYAYNFSWILQIIFNWKFYLNTLNLFWIFLCFDV